LNASFQVKALPEKTVVQDSDKTIKRLDYIIALFLLNPSCIFAGNVKPATPAGAGVAGKGHAVVLLAVG
jgi:hypothetical protein